MSLSRITLALSAPALLALAGLAPSQDAAPPPKATPPQEAAAAPDLTLRYLANEGFLLQSREHGVLIDAFVKKPFFGYAALPDEMAEKLTWAKPPFDGVDVALVSHIHPDHFQADIAHSFLSADKDAQLWSGDQVLAAIRKRTPELALADARLKSFWCPEGEKRSAKLEGIEIEFFPLFHKFGIENLGHLIRLGGRLVFHPGDADLDEKVLAPYELPKRGIDVAVVPYWWLLTQQDCDNTRKWVGAGTYIAAHIAPAEIEGVRLTIAKYLSGVVILEKGGDTFTVPAPIPPPAPK